MAVLLVLGFLAQPACYTTRVLSGGTRILAKRKPVEKVLQQNELGDEERRKLELTQRLLDFAVQELCLPDNGSYRTYVQLDSPYAMWNVVAAPELSVEPLSWCFPVAGCVSYRGYYKKQRAIRFAEKLEDKGHDVQVGGVDAYSTLGWFKDPVFSTFLARRDVDLAALLFHELAHQRLYVKGDTTFNESFATVVELEGLRRWLDNQGHPEEIERLQHAQETEAHFVELVTGCRQRLAQLYDSALSDDEKRERKAELLAELKQEYDRTRRDWDGNRRYDAWFDRPLNNAHLAAVADYYDLVPLLEALLHRSDGALGEFFEQAEQLQGLDPEQRRRKLEKLVDGEYTE